MIREVSKLLINEDKQHIILLGPSGTSKTFMIQQEAQRTFMIYILCNDGVTDQLERDSSFTLLRTYLKEKSVEKIDLVNIFMISRVLYLKIALEKAQKEGIELNPVDFFLMQLNGNSKQSQELFHLVYKTFLDIKTPNYSMILKELIDQIIEGFSYVKEKRICITIDEAGVANHLFENQ